MDWILHDPLTRFLVQVAVIVTASRLVGLVTRRAGQPLVIAEIIAGIMLGPSLFGWAAPGAYGDLFPAASLGVVRMVSQLGLVLFMFLVGLELDPRMLRGRSHTSVAISHSSIVVPFLLGVAVAVWIHARYADPQVSLTSFALFLGAAMSITAFPVLARILSERGLLRTRMGAITIACAAVDDVTAWCILAFVVATSRATGLDGALLTTASALAFIVAMVVLVRPLLARVGRRIATPEAMTQNVVALTLVLVLASSWATERIGIHALFGAFLFGAILPKDGGFARALAEKLEDVVVVVLLPLFFALSGLRTEIGLLDSSQDWLVCAVIIVAACVGKFGGSAVAARLTGLSWRESSALGVLMNTRGLMELIVLNIGLDLGVISPTVFSMMVLMALVTTFVASPLLQWIYPPHVMARDLAEDQPAPEPPARDRVMICVSHAETGPSMLAMARLVTPAGARVLALHLAPPDDYGPSPPEGETADDVLGPTLARAREAGLTVRPLAFVSTQPAAEICRVADARAVELILLGVHKPVLSLTMLGGVVHEVLTEARATVGIVVDRGLAEVRRILVPFQGSRHDRAALALAGRIQATTGASITVLHVIRPGHAASVATFEQLPGPVTVETVAHEAPAAVAVERSRGHDLVVVGVGKEWGLGERPLGVGLTSERMIRDCPGSLLIVRAGEDGTVDLAPARITQG